MAAFSQVAKNAKPPGRTLLLEPWVFADEWGSKPDGPVCVGLRLLAESDKSKARAEAERLADELHPRRGPNWVDAFNDALIRQVSALGACDPNDVMRPMDLLPFAEEQVRVALTSRGARFIFDEIDRYEIESSPIGIMIEQDDISDLADLLPSVVAEKLSPGLRRLLRHVMDELESLSPSSEQGVVALEAPRGL